MARPRDCCGPVPGCGYHSSGPISQRPIRLRYRTFSASLRCFGGPAAGLAQRFCQRFGHVLALAAAHSLSCLRRFSGSIVVVCGPSPLRKYRRLYCAYPLLLFSFTDSGKRSVARRAGDCCGLGRVRSDLHGDCGSAHTLRPPRSRALELAANRSAWHLPRNRCGIAVLPDRGGPDGSRLLCFTSLRCVVRRES